MDNSAIYVFILIRYGDSVVLATSTAILLSIIADIDWEIRRLTVSVNFSIGVTVPVVFHSDGWSTKAEIAFVLLGGIVRLSIVITGWGFAVVSLEAVLTCIVKCGNHLGPCVVSMTTLLFLIKSNPIIGPVNFFITTKCSANMFSPISNLTVVVANGFSNWPLAFCFSKIGRIVDFEIFIGIFLFYCVRIILGTCTGIGS